MMMKGFGCVFSNLKEGGSTKQAKPDKAAKPSAESRSMNLDELRAILTLRYYPKGPTLLPKLTWRDFIPYSGIENVVKPLIEGAIRAVIDYGKPKTIGIAISGGVDSTTVLALTRKLYPQLDIKSLCITFGQDTGEATDAQNAADMFETDHVHMNLEGPFQTLPAQIAILKVPRWNAYTYFIFEYFAKKKVDMVLTGDGGDENFGGYAFRYKQILSSAAERIDARTYLDAHKMDWVPDQPKLFGTRMKFSWEEIYSYLNEYFSNPLTKLGQVFLADYSGKLLYDFAPTNTAFAKHFALESVAPMLNTEVIYTAGHLPYEFKYDYKNNIGKVILRQILLGNFAYKAAVKGKIGFGMDRFEMWRTNKARVTSLLDNARCVKMDLVDKEWLKNAFDKAESETEETRLRYITRLFAILALEVWLRLFVTKEMKATDKL
jgi:asparagine synthase (glutamine-hydrolysing)